MPQGSPPPALPEIYQAGAWAGLTLTTLLVTLYGWRLAEEQRQMATALAAAQAALEREQRMSALGALAAAVVLGFAWWWRTVGPYAQFGMAPRHEVAAVLGRGHLMRRRGTIRPDSSSRSRHCR